MKICFNPISSIFQLHPTEKSHGHQIEEFNALRDSLEHNRCHEQLGSQVCVVLPFQVVSLIHKMLNRLFAMQQWKASLCVRSPSGLHGCIRQPGKFSLHSCRRNNTIYTNQCPWVWKTPYVWLVTSGASAGKPPRRLALPGAIARQNFLPRPSSFLRTVARIAYIYTQCFIIHHCAYFTQTVREGWLEILTWIVHDSSGVVRIIQHFMLSSPAMQSLSRKLSVLLQVTFSNFQVNAWKSISMFVMAFCAVQRCAAGKLDSKKQVA